MHILLKRPLEAYMLRVFIIMGLGLALSVTTACNGGGKKRVKLGKTLGKDIDTKNFDPPVVNVLEKAKDDKCLRVDRLLNGLAKLNSQNVIYYVRGRDIGMVSAGTQKQPLNFTTEMDTNGRAVKYLSGTSEKESMQNWIHKITGDLLQKIDNEALYVAAIDDACKTVDIDMAGKKSKWTVTYKSGKRLDIAKNGSVGQIISYMMNNKGVLFINEYRRVKAIDLMGTCGNINPQASYKFSTGVVFGKNLNRLTIDANFSESLLPALEGNEELTNMLSGNSARYEMKVEQYEKILAAVKDSNKNFTCQ